MKLTASTLESGAYTTTFSGLLNEYIPPMCPTSVVGAPQLYNSQSRQCVSIPAATIPPAGHTAQSCGGAPFQVSVGGQCYPTNNCTTTPTLTSSCIAGQNLPYQKQPLEGPGVLANMGYH